jgi:hypothetical protein
MSVENRRNLISQIEKIRGSSVICYLTTLRQNVPGQMAEDAVRVFFDHLLALPQRPVSKLDIFLCSNGGSTTVPWRLVSLFREFATSFNVLIPYRAYSAATMLALGADEIVMHPFGELGPIDPTVANEFNPVENGRRIGISVEDVKAYINFVKSTVGITHEDELVQAINGLIQKVHPLALGNVDRFLSQSRMIGKKILLTHMDRGDDHAIREIVENMASKLYFHGHPINRREARQDLNLKVQDPAPDLEKAMWELYRDFEDEFENLKPFNPVADLLAAGPPAAGTPNAKQYVLVHAAVESAKIASRHSSKRRVELMPPDPAGNQPVRDESFAQEWTHQSAPTVPSPVPPSKTFAAGTPAARKGRRRA